MKKVFVKNENEIDLLIEDNKISNFPLLVKFSADYCPPCRSISKNIDLLIEEDRENFLVAEVDVTKLPKLCSREVFNVFSIPSSFLFISGKLVKKKIGNMSLDELRKFIYD